MLQVYDFKCIFISCNYYDIICIRTSLFHFKDVPFIILYFQRNCFLTLLIWTKHFIFINTQLIKIINDATVQQVSKFAHSGFEVTYNYSNYVIHILYKFQYLCSTVRRFFKNARRDTLLKIYKVMAVPALIYGCDKFSLTREGQREIESAETRIIRAVARYT